MLNHHQVRSIEALAGHAERDTKRKPRNVPALAEASGFGTMRFTSVPPLVNAEG